jgi:hemerythrin-like domain-containing protein
MSVKAGDIRELLGEHEGIRAHMKFLAKSQKDLLSQDIQAKEKIWAYRCGLHDFKDAIQFHIETDKRIFKSFSGEILFKEPTEEHEEIQKLLDELIELADNTAIDKLDTQELNEYTGKIGLAVNKIFDLVEVHIATENKVLEQALNGMYAGNL